MAPSTDRIEIDGGRGAAVRLERGDRLRLENTFGSQVVDTWAFAAADPGEYLSVEHSRRVTGHLHPVTGDTFVSNRRNPMLTLLEDSFGGTHDTLVACCDAWLYRHLGAADGHRNCHDNCVGALADLGIVPTHVPNPVNLWMNVPVEGNTVELTAPLSRPGDHVVLAAEMDLIVAFSACPMDLTPVNGPDLTPRPVHYRILGREG